MYATDGSLPQRTYNATLAIGGQGDNEKGEARIWICLQACVVQGVPDVVPMGAKMSASTFSGTHQVFIGRARGQIGLLSNKASD